MKKLLLIKGNNMKNNKLHNIKSTGFKTPDNYFESLEDAIYSKLAEDTLSSKINSNGFEVPEDYFETFDDKVLSAVNENDSTKVIPPFSWKKISYISGIAASLVLIFNILFTDTDELTFDDLETASIENYLLNEDLNAYEIAPYLGASELDSNDFVDTNIKSSDIEDYLIQNSDVEQLITD